MNATAKRSLMLLCVFCFALFSYWIGIWSTYNVLEFCGGGTYYAFTEYVTVTVGMILDPMNSAILLVVSACFALLQVFFLAPLVGPLRLQATGRSLRTSVIAAACIASLLSFALALAIVHTAMIYLPDARISAEGSDAIISSVGLGMIMISAWAALGVVWTLVLWKTGNTRDPNAIALLTRRIFAGSAIELALGIPLFLLARRKTDCVCSLGAFWAIIVGLMGLFWLCGPACVLLLTKDARRNWTRGACRECGYPRRTQNNCCSECGHEYSKPC
ncbi:MAG: hypothetical protein EXS10_04635 [Phycisphaerales bacterium]|nr:hypothetical protein [Phycisphaerales bacterium]